MRLTRRLAIFFAIILAGLLAVGPYPSVWKFYPTWLITYVTPENPSPNAEALAVLGAYAIYLGLLIAILITSSRRAVYTVFILTSVIVILNTVTCRQALAGNQVASRLHEEGG